MILDPTKILTHIEVHAVNECSTNKRIDPRATHSFIRRDLRSRSVIPSEARNLSDSPRDSSQKTTARNDMFGVVRKSSSFYIRWQSHNLSPLFYS